MRVAMVALTTSGAAGDYVSALSNAMTERTTTGAWVPDRPILPLSAETHVITKPRSRFGVVGREAAAWLRSSELGAQLQAWKPEVVHFVFGEGYPTAARAATALASWDIPVAVTWHDPQPHGQLVDRVQHSVAARTIRAAGGLHVHCERVAPKDFGPGLLVAEHPAFPCPSCLGVGTTQPPHTEGTIVMVGRFAPYKGLDVMCDALTEYWGRGGQRRFVVVGQGTVPGSLRRLHARWPSLVSIENAYISGERLHDVLSAAAICVLPYLTGTQSALPWLARLHGAHVIATDVGCIGEVSRRIGGRVVAPGSASGLVDALLEPPGAWHDVGRLSLPTFGTLADRLLEWYPTLSSR